MRLFEGTEFDRPLRCEQCGELDEKCVCPPEQPAETLTLSEPVIAAVTSIASRHERT